jgi:hypothetical protein
MSASHNTDDLALRSLVIAPDFRAGGQMFEFPNSALTVFAVLTANPQSVFSPLLTAAFAEI